VASQIDRVRRPFNVSSVAQAAAVAALDDEAHVARSCAAARDGLEALTRGLGGLGLHVLPTPGNFVLVDLARDAAPIHQAVCSPRRATAGERVLALAPAGADAVLEVDLARLRANRTVGPVLRALGVATEVGGNLAATADLLVFVSYRVGDSDAAQLVFAAGPRV